MRWISEGLPDMQVAVLPRSEINFKDGCMSRDSREPGPMTTASRTSSSRPAAPLGCSTVSPTAAHRRPPAWNDANHRGRSRIVALGVAKSMLDDVQELAATKYRMSDMESLASRPTFQKGSRTTAQAGAPLVFWCSTRSPPPRPPLPRGVPHSGLAGRHAGGRRLRDRHGRSCAEWAHLVAGTSSIREGSRLERAFRDVYTGTQHAFISEKVAIDAAQIWLGIIEDKPGL